MSKTDNSFVTTKSNFVSKSSKYSHGLYSSVARSCGKSSLSRWPSSSPLANQRPWGKCHFLPSDGQSITTFSRNHAPPPPALSWPILYPVTIIIPINTTRLCSDSANLRRGEETSTKCDPQFESGFGSGCLPDHSQNVVDSLPCRRQSFRKVFWKSASDCVRKIS